MKAGVGLIGVSVHYDAVHRGVLGMSPPTFLTPFQCLFLNFSSMSLSFKLLLILLCLSKLVEPRTHGIILLLPIIKVAAIPLKEIKQDTSSTLIEFQSSFLSIDTRYASHADLVGGLCHLGSKINIFAAALLVSNGVT
jgi:hypothetical protein